MDIIKYHKNVLEDFNEFSKITTDWIDSELKTSNEWNLKRPTNEKEFEDFYSNSEIYGEALAHYNYSSKKTTLARKLVKALEYLDVKKIVEIGTGVGSDSLMLNDLGYKVTTMDLPSEYFEFSKKRFKKYKANIKTLYCWEDKVPKCDLIFHLYVLEHVFDPIEFMRKQLGKSKYILFTASFGEHKEEHGGMPQHTDFKVQDIEKFLIKNGYEKIKIPGMCFPPRLFKKI